MNDLKYKDKIGGVWVKDTTINKVTKVPSALGHKTNSKSMTSSRDDIYLPEMTYILTSLPR